MIQHRLLTATRRDRVYYVYHYDVRQRERFSSEMARRMMMDPHSLWLPCFCLLWKAAPNILLSLNGAVHNQFFQYGRDNPVLMAVRISLMSLLADFTSKLRPLKRADRKQADSPARLDYRTPR
jgi:hypothetical protein